MWYEEHTRRLQICKTDPRLQLITAELTKLAEKDKRKCVQQQDWPGAPYLQFVDRKFHARPLACTRLGVLPIEIETGRWNSTPQAELLCNVGCRKLGDLSHFLHGSGVTTATGM